MKQKRGLFSQTCAHSGLTFEAQARLRLELNKTDLLLLYTLMERKIDNLVRLAWTLRGKAVNFLKIFLN